MLGDSGKIDADGGAAGASSGGTANAGGSAGLGGLSGTAGDAGVSGGPGASGASSTGGTSSSSGLALLLSTPENDATGVNTSVMPELTFSAKLNAASANGSISLREAAGSAELPLALSVLDSAITVMPAAKLSPFTKYLLSASTELLSADGKALGELSTVTFTTGDRSWQKEAMVEIKDSEGSSSPEVVIDASGHALAIWTQHENGDGRSLWSSQYTKGIGWGTAAAIETGSGAVNAQKLAQYADGNAIAVWKELDGSLGNIWTNYYTKGIGWGTAVPLENSAEEASVPQVTMATNGNAIAAWSQHDGIRDNLWSRRYTKGVGWGAAELIETSDSSGAIHVQIAIASNGDALAVWSQLANGFYSIHASFSLGGGAWGNPTLLESSDGTALSPQVSFDPGGNASVVWQQVTGAETSIWSNRYAKGAGWGTAELIETTAGGTYYPRLAIDGSGNAIAAWSQNDGAVISNIWSNRYTAGIGWGTAELVEDIAGGLGYAPQIAIDDNGDALLLWHHTTADKRSDIWFNRYLAGAGWGKATTVEGNDANSAANPRVAMTPSGKAMAVWFHYMDTRYDIWFNTFE